MRSIADDVQAIGRMSAVPTILEVVARTTGMRFTAVARVTDTKWTACAVYDLIDFGLKPGGELQLETTICNEIRQHGLPVLFGHASQHPQFNHHPTPKLYGFESYISIPIMQSNGAFFGTLCAIDPLPAKLDDPNVLKTLQLFAQLIAANLDTDEQLQRSEALLATAQDNAKLREQFIAVLGHDLRTPLHSISIAMGALEKGLTDTRALSMAKIVNRSCSRMAELIENILDFARGKLGSGIPVVLQPNDQLAADLRQVISEIQIAYPERTLEVSIDLSESVTCDNPRIAQLLGNLLSNAMTHGDARQAVRIAARTDAEIFELTVANGGPRIPAAIVGKLFEPFTRSSDGAPNGGLGLGLYIASEIAKAHRGTLEVTSDSEHGTCFIFRMRRQA